MKLFFHHGIPRIALVCAVLLMAMVSGCDDDISGPGDTCSTPPSDPIPVPTNLANPDTCKFTETFTATWDHVWTGCGGYEFGYRRAATATWITTDVRSGSEVDITIPRPDGYVNNPTSYELRVRSFWESSDSVRIYSEYSQSGNIEMALACANACSFPPLTPMPVPTNFTSPDSATFGVPFPVSWTHVWTGCGGYEFEYRRAGTNTWLMVKVVSGSSASITIELPSPPVNNPTSYEIRVRSYWGGDCDAKVFSNYSQSGNVEMRVP